MALAYLSAEALVSMMMGEDAAERNKWFPDAYRLSRIGSGEDDAVTTVTG